VKSVFLVQTEVCSLGFHYFAMVLVCSWISDSRCTIISLDTRQALIEHFKDEYHHYMLQAAIYYEALSCLSFPGTHI
jgi:tRNA pseudouridine38/39 synthase